MIIRLFADFKGLSRPLQMSCMIIAAPLPQAARSDPAGVAGDEGPKSASNWSTGVATSAAGARRYRLLKPPACSAASACRLWSCLARLWAGRGDALGSQHEDESSSRVQALSCALTAEQERIANPQACLNRYAPRSGWPLSMLRLIRFASRSRSIRSRIWCWQDSPRRRRYGGSLGDAPSTAFSDDFYAFLESPGVAYSSSTAVHGNARAQVAALPARRESSAATLRPRIAMNAVEEEYATPGAFRECIEIVRKRCGRRVAKRAAIPALGFNPASTMRFGSTGCDWQT